VIDQGSELCDISAQFDVLGAPPHGGLASLCLRKLRAATLMLVKALRIGA